MTPRRRPVAAWGTLATLPAAALGIALVLAACGGPPAAALSPCPRQNPPPLGDPPYHHDPELESRVPAEIAGSELRFDSWCAVQSEQGGLMVAPELLEQLDVEAADVTILQTIPSIGDDLGLTLSAWRYHGVAEDDIRAAFRRQVETAGETLATAVRGGKQVDLGTSQLLRGIVFYVSGDTLYSLSGADEHVDEALAALP